jgi:hypothetical protein
MLGSHSITSAAVGCIDFVNIAAVAVAVAVAAVVAVVQGPVLGGADNECVRLLVEDEQVIVHPVVDCHRIDRIECHLGVVDRN